LDQIGETGLWLTSAGRDDAAGLVLEVFVARQGAVLEVVLHGYAEDRGPDLELLVPMRTLAARVSILVPPTRLRYVTPAPLPPTTDLSTVALRKEDLPAGFVALAEVDWAAITGAETLSNSLRFSGAARQNETAFIVPAADSPLYVLGWVDYPLTEMEAALLRKEFAYASAGTGAGLLGIPANNWRSPSLLTGLAGVGETVFGVTGLDNRTRPATRVQVIRVYRGGALITLLASYADGAEAEPDVVDIARSLDGRLKEALP
jgi:hypothetical protein